MRCGVLLALFMSCHLPDESKAVSNGEFVPFELFEGEVPADCDCVPFYQCSYSGRIERTKACKTTEVCCYNVAPAEDVWGWGAAADHARDASHGEFPWMVAILNVNANETWTDDEYVGGGAIIHPTVVLTAAHTVDGKQAETLKCRAGEWIRIKNEHNAPQERLVERLDFHPRYERMYTANDVALLFLKAEFDVSLPMVRPIYVGKGAPPQGSECFAMGWGKLEFNSTNYAEKLKKVSAPLVPRTVCWRALQAVDAARQKKRENSRETHVKSVDSGQRREALEMVKTQDSEREDRFQRQEQTKLMLHSSLLCAGGEGEDTCTGDGGSPLVCQLQMNATHTRYAVYGLVAWGIGCGVAGSPGVYVDVAQFYNWIITKLPSGDALTNIDYIKFYMEKLRG